MKVLVIIAVVAISVASANNCPIRACQTRLCYNGHVKDADGCDTCDCCPERSIMCLNYCPNGRAIGPDGCPSSCRCKVCEPVRCRMICPNGFKKGPDGCQICECNW